MEEKTERQEINEVATLASRIEAVLFAGGKSFSVQEIASILDVNKRDVDEGLSKLEDLLDGRGVVIVRNESEVRMATDPKVAPDVQKVRSSELAHDLGEAAMETLSIILYRGPVSKKQIDFIRGVNSQHIVRNLLVRGLIDRSQADTQERSYTYKPTLDLLSYLGVKKQSDLPDFEKVQKEIEDFEAQNEQGDQ